MSVDINKTVIRRLFREVFNQGRLDVIDEIVAKKVHGQDAAIERSQSRDDFKQVAMIFQTAFPRAKITIHDLIAEDDKVVARWSLSGSHQGTFMDVTPTGKHVCFDGIIIYRLEDRKIVEYWGSFDTLDLMRKFGAVALLGQEE